MKQAKTRSIIMAAIVCLILLAACAPADAEWLQDIPVTPQVSTDVGYLHMGLNGMITRVYDSKYGVVCYTYNSSISCVEVGQ